MVRELVQHSQPIGKQIYRVIIITEMRADITINGEELFRILKRVNQEIEKTEDNLTNMAVSVETQTQESYNQVMGMMRASYMMVSGVTQVLGGTMNQIFSSMYAVAVSAIMTYKAIAAAMAASGVGATQALVMSISLVSAISSLTSVMAGQKELSRRISNLNMSLHGLSVMIGVLNF